MEKMELYEADKKKLLKNITANSRTFIGAFIIFAVIVIMTTDIKLVTASDFSALGVNFFLLLVCTFSFYSLCSDNGTKNGLIAKVYVNAIERFGRIKKRILDEQKYTKLNDFCTHYISEDLKNARLQYLSVAGIGYEEYLSTFSKLSNEEVDLFPELSQLQRKAIKKANDVRPIKLTPKMIMQNGSDYHSRSPLPFSPETKRRIMFGTTAVKMIVFTATFTAITMEMFINPSWLMFVEICAKIMSVLLNGYQGYKDGYGLIAEYTTRYLDCQSDLMEQSLHYIDALET